MPNAAGSSFPGGRRRLSGALLSLSPSALRWWAGAFCAFLGAFVIVAPQEFSGEAYRALHVRPLSWGVWFVVAGGVLLVAAALRPRRAFLFVAHALAASAFAFFGGSFAGAGAWTGAVIYSVLAAGLFATGLLPERPPPSHERRRGDAFSILIGVAAAGVGVVLLSFPPGAGPGALYDVTPESRRLAGALLLLAGPLLVGVHLRPGTRRSFTWVAHLAAAAALTATVFVLALPVRVWTGVALYGSAGLTIGVLPWLRRQLRQVDSSSLATRLALALGATTSIGLLLVVALLQSASDREAESLAVASQQDEATSVARNVVDYLELIAARSQSLAARAGRARWSPGRQHDLIAAAVAEKQRIAAIGVFQLDGTPVAEAGRRAVSQLAVLRLLHELRLAAEAGAGQPPAGAVETAVVRLWTDTPDRLLLAAAPVVSPLGRTRGILVTAYDPEAVLWRLSRPGLVATLSDAEGRVLASQRRARDLAGERRMEAEAPVPGLDWTVSVDRSRAMTLAAVRRERLLAFGLLVAAVLAAIGIGIVMARAIASPLRRLAAAADQLAAGNPDVPLRASGVSELDRLSANFRDMRERLEARTRERERLAEELRERARALAEADRRKDEFLAMLAHELRNPLGAISNAAYLLDQIVDPDPRVGRSVAVIRRQMRHLTRMVDDLLDVSRITRGKVQLQRAPLDLRDVVRRTVESYHPLFDGRQHQLAVSLPDDPLPLLADATRLDQVLGNLLRNAALYTEPGGHVEVTAGRDGERAVLRVRDDGVGIPPELLPQIFELFTQGHQTLDRAGGGLGIGLTLVQQLVDLHGGEVRAASDGAGRGSTFEVRLPLAAAGAAAGEAGEAGTAGGVEAAVEHPAAAG